MRKTIVTFALLLLGVCCFFIWNVPSDVRKPSAQAEIFVPTQLPSSLEKMEVYTNTTTYKVVVGANPVMNGRHVFEPPIGSVTVSNEAQLQLLREQAKQARQQKQVQQ